MEKPSIELQSRFGLGLRLYFRYRPHLQQMIPTSVKDLQSGHRSFFCVLAELEDFFLIHVFQQPLRCFTEPVDLLRLAHILKKLFLVPVGFKLLDQLGDGLSFFFFSSSCS